MVEQRDALIQAGKILKEAFSAIEKWKDEERVSKQIEQMEILQKQLKERNEELQQTHKMILEATNNLSETKGMIIQLDKHLLSLNRIKEGFNLALSSLLEKIQLLGEETTNLSTVKNEILQAAEIFRKYSIQTK